MKKIIISNCYLALVISFLLFHFGVKTYAAESYYWPVPSAINTSREFSKEKEKEHYAIDIIRSDGQTTEGAPIYASKSGTVTFFYNNCSHKYGDTCSHGGGNGTGNCVFIKHDDGTWASYNHMYHGSISKSITVGARVKQGQYLGRVGNTGNSQGPHLHFSIRKEVSGKTSFWSWTPVDNSRDKINYVYNYTPLSDPGILYGSTSSNIGSTTARVSAKLYPTSDVTETGFYLGLTADSMKKYADKNAAKNVKSVYFDLGTGKWTSELKRGTTYYYQVYVVSGGKTYKTGSVKTFKTKGDVTLPTISNVKMYDISCKGYTISCEVTDDVGIDYVTFPTWTEANGQDDLVYIKGTKQSDGKTYVFNMSINQHNSEQGYYHTHIYAYDTSGNISLYQVNGNYIDHVATSDAAVAATCTVNGYTEGSHCCMCGQTIVAQQYVPALGHTLVSDLEIYPNWQSGAGERIPGKTAGSHCITCGAIITAQLDTGYIEINGCLDNEWSDSISPYGTVDIYIGDVLVADDATDFHGLYCFCTPYTIKDIKANPGYEYVGVCQGNLSGYLNVDSWGADLKFNKCQYNLCFDPNGGAFTDGNSEAVYACPKLIYQSYNWNDVSGYYPVRKGYIFDGWFTAPTGGVRVYGADNKPIYEGTYWNSFGYAHAGDLTVYAHWQECVHVPNTDMACTTDQVCTICGVVLKEANGHKLPKEWKSDGINHWQECTVCNEKINSGVHEGGEASCVELAHCKICDAGYGDIGEHKYSDEWQCDDINHWHECSFCGEKKDINEHTLTTTTELATKSTNGKIETKCDICEKVTKKTIIYAAKTIYLSNITFEYDGTTKTPSLVVKDSRGKNISKKYYDVKYGSGRKNVGKYKVTLTFKERYEGTENLSFNINPKSTSIKSIKSEKKAFILSWNKQTKQVDGYEIRYSTSSKFTGTVKTVKVTDNGKTSKTISKLLSNTKYYVQIRTYRESGSKKYYSSWSSTESVKTK